MPKEGRETEPPAARARESLLLARKTEAPPVFRHARSRRASPSSGRVARTESPPPRRLHRRYRRPRARSGRSQRWRRAAARARARTQPENSRSDRPPRRIPFQAQPERVLRGADARFPLYLRVSRCGLAKVAELVDAPALGAGAERRESSSLSFRTRI